MSNGRAQSLDRTVADAVLAVPGVACLRPGLRALLHAPGVRPAGAGASDPDSAVRITRDSQGRVTAMHIRIVVRAERQAARTAQAVRAAAAGAAAAAPEVVRVTVTGIV
ncbi:hypothetical protein PUR59_12520 [Streptomyces sp. SP18ES09]|uniref:hypothetical protein n=1 Tax=Streptomyces sp. SP18ES09 TaxID=3002532 RepID=UPI002E765F4E|nr:hypothetical protein [Streptomyces sp. SP18ES09]MEE1815830.1 hypothetical protein [Streptomyces sp. SP18ES09]